MFKTRITTLFGIEHPIVGGCMMHVSTPEFVAAISNAGALGMIASAMYPTQDEFRRAVRRTKDLTGQPFGVNLSLFPALRPIDNDLYVDVILDEGVPIVETSGRRPPEALLARLKAGGIKTMHKCASVRHAVSAQAAGVDAVTVFGTEGGGHIGESGVTTMVLVPRAADELDVPLLAAGGIADGRGLLAALALGAEGVTIGTRLLVTEECPIHHHVKQALIAATELDTLPILGSLHNTVRAWKNPAALKVAELEARQAELWEILAIVAGTETRRMIEKGEIEAGVLACSQGVGLVREIQSVAEVIGGMVQETKAVREMICPSIV
ncbi:MAG: nitronate monooxygenase [Anaerolineae bacterium]|nr:nitronate monooxygenase [Anaerolineae bacterium]